MLVTFGINEIVDIFVSASSIPFLISDARVSVKTCETCIEKVEVRTIGERNFAVRYNTIRSTVFKFQRLKSLKFEWVVRSNHSGRSNCYSIKGHSTALILSHFARL